VGNLPVPLVGAGLGRFTFERASHGLTVFGDFSPTEQRAIDMAILNPSCDADKPAVPDHHATRTNRLCRTVMRRGQTGCAGPSCDADKPAAPGRELTPCAEPP
jgi:hypothetical protein